MPQEVSSDDTPLPCAGKLAFDTKAQAQTAALIADWQHGTSLKTYLCKHCQLWHLATKNTESDSYYL